MDRRLIFLHLHIFRWSDEVQYAKRIIGFDVYVVKMEPRKIRALQFNLKFKRQSDPEATAKESLQSVPPRKTSKIKYV